MENEIQNNVNQTPEANIPPISDLGKAGVQKQDAATVSTEKKVVKSKKRVLQGKVASNKADKTIIVSIERQVAHPLYKKYYKRTKRVMAHDQNNECKIGDTVKVRECRPLSAKKRWELFEIVVRAK